MLFGFLARKVGRNQDSSRTTGERTRQRPRRLAAESLERRDLLAAVTPVAPFTLPALGDDSANDVVFDAAGNRYLTGNIRQTVDFDPGPADASLTSAGGYDAFVAKYATDGSLVWARTFGGTTDERGDRIVVDAGGDVYVRGTFDGGMTVDSVSLSAVELDEEFLLKLDTAGTAVWGMASGAGRSFTGIAVDDRTANPADWSVYLVGDFSGTKQFGSQTLSSNGTKSDAFVSRLTAASGTYQWTKKTSGKGTEAFWNVALDRNGAGALFITGIYEEQAIVGSTTLKSAKSDIDGFAAKVDLTGNFLWARAVAQNTSRYANSTAIATVGGDAYITGRANTSAKFGNIQISGLGLYDMYVAKLDSNGTFRWAAATASLASTSHFVFSESIATDASGNVFVAGEFQGRTRFGGDTLASQFLGTSTNYSLDGFVSQLNAATGQFMKSWRAGGNHDDFLNGVAADAAGGIAVAGFYRWTADFPDGTVLTNPSTSGTGDIVVLNFAAGASAPLAIVTRARAASSSATQSERAAPRLVAIAAKRLRSVTVESAQPLDPASVDRVLRATASRHPRQVAQMAKSTSAEAETNSPS